MDVLLSAVASDLVGRLVSFLIGKYQERGATDTTVRLQRLLLRARAVVEETEGRQIANRAMLLQLRKLTRELCRGAYVLDDIVDPSGRSHTMASGFRPFFNQPIPGADSANDGIAVAVETLEAALSDMREFVVLLGGCPRITRQPYSAYLFMESCMFGRQVEKEQIISFLLQPAHQGLAVLPIIGPHDVGKRTLVEHVCLDERVCGHFTEIHRLRSDELDLPMDDATARSLFVIHLADGDAGEEAWRRFRSSMRLRGSKVIISSRTERHSTLGTVPPLRLLVPRREELWYLFKGLAFGGADPEQLPELVRVAVALFEVCLLDLSPFTTVHNLGVSLRADMSARSWRRVLNVSAAATVLPPGALSGERDGPEGNWGSPRTFNFLCRPVKDASGTPFLFCDRRKSTGMARDELPNVTILELVTGGAAAPGGETRFDVLVWQSRIPPYASYVVACDVERARQAVADEMRVHKRKRGQQDDMRKRIDSRDRSRAAGPAVARVHQPGDEDDARLPRCG